MPDYSYWEQHVEKFNEEFGRQLAIDYCSLSISNDYTQNSPRVIFGKIFMPTQYLDLLNGHCNLILCNQNPVSKYSGNYKQESLDEENFDMPDYTLPVEEFRNKYLPPNIITNLPIDNRRKKIAGLLRDLITAFAIYHEIGHVRQQKFSKSQEVGVEQSNDEKWNDQAQEIDADIFGINWLWRIVFYNFNQFQPNESFHSNKELLELALYSTFLFFYLSNNETAINNPFGEHPHPIVRFDIISIFLKQIVTSNDLFTINEDEFKKNNQ